MPIAIATMTTIAPMSNSTVLPEIPAGSVRPLGPTISGLVYHIFFLLELDVPEADLLADPIAQEHKGDPERER
jgi:hypothetical protein